MRVVAFILIAGLVLTATAEDKLVIANLAKNAVLVARVRLIFSHHLRLDPRFDVYAVHVIRFYKNESHEPLQDLTVRAFNGRPGVPQEECTIYLQHYDGDARNMFSTDRNTGAWILAGGDATNGVSNVSTKARGE